MTVQPGQGGSVPARAQISVDAGRLWAGGGATAIVAALVAVLGVLICRDILDLSISKPALVFRPTSRLVFNYGFTAAVAALLATGLAHLLSLTTPRPRVFFGWIVALLTVASMVVPFGREGELEDQLAVAAINLMVGLSIGSLLSAVLSRTVVDAERSWQQP